MARRSEEALALRRHGLSKLHTALHAPTWQRVRKAGFRSRELALFPLFTLRERSASPCRTPQRWRAV